MDMFLVDTTEGAAKSLMIKLAEQSRPGAIIALTKEEMSVYRSDAFAHVIVGGNDSDVDISEIDSSKRYVMVINDCQVNIKDLEIGAVKW